MRNLITTIVTAAFCIPAWSQLPAALKKGTSFSAKNKTITVYTTAENTRLRISSTDNLNFQPAEPPVETEIYIMVNPAKTFQTFMGIGGAITDASAEVFAKLTAGKQQELLDAYYSRDKGIGYTLARTNIHSCDFSSGSYTYISEGDAALKTFSIAHDQQYRIPLIKKAIATAGGKLLLFVSPWSPPAFMKDTKDMLHGGKLLPQFYQPWANYYARFIKAYEAQGIPVWGTTIQNEPLAKQTWESCNYTAAEERDFIKNYLGPTLQRQGLGNKKIVIWDHNRDLMNYRADIIYSDPAAAKYIWGMGFHWYETWTGGQPMFSNVTNVHQSYPGKNLLFTEGCVERFDTAKYQLWANGERYGLSMINDFNNGTAGWTDWNILLDEQGGPNHVGNFCFAPIHADTRTGELIYTPSYYYIGQFSKFIRPGATRVSAVSSRSSLGCTTFLNTDATMVTVVMNAGAVPVTYKLFVDAQAAAITIMPHAIQTIVY